MSDAFLGVERSATGKAWRLRAGDPEIERAGLALSQRLGLSELVGRVMAARGVALDAAETFLAPTLRALLPDPSHLRDMDVAAARLVDAIRAGETIAVFGDYDVDGATTSALLQRFLSAVGARVRVYIPDRMKEGYGPNAPALLKLKQEGAGVVVTVDCGVTAFQPLAAAAEAGLTVIVVDHHVAEPALPAAHAIVNPNRLDETSPHRQLAAVGVAFLLVVAVNRALRESGWYATRPAPDLMGWLDLVALGTVCDVVPLTGLNRALVAQGLKVMARRANAGIAALADIAGLRDEPDAYACGFLLGPRVNAGGRVGRAGHGAHLLATDDPAEARALAVELDRYNAERRAIEAAVLDDAITRVDQGGLANGPAIVVAAEGWHPGVIGIVASRLRERYNRPCCVVALENGIGKGSGRSVPGVRLGEAVIGARQAGLLVNGGGHAMAAGFTLEEARLPGFTEFLAARVLEAQGAAPTRPTLGLDGALQVTGASTDLVEQILRLGPFGVGNSEPRFALPAVRIVHAEAAGADHVRCALAGGPGGRLRAIAFRAMDSGLGAALLGARGLAMHVAGRLKLDRWQGREEVQLFIDDVAPASGA